MEKLKQIKVKSTRLKKEISFLKVKEQILGQQLGRDAPVLKKNQVRPKG